MKFEKSIVLSTLSLAAGLASTASADVFTFTYSDSSGVVAIGNLNATDNGNGITMTCVAGDITFLAGPYTGTYPLIPGASGNFEGWAYDSLLYVGSPSLDPSGLLFGISGGSLWNLWNDGGGVPYTLGTNVAGYAQQNGQFVISPAVPTPGAAALIGVGGLLATRRRRAV